jgi:phospholipid/cholesterol/gamma-HCH transport system substrate-binding protein
VSRRRAPVPPIPVALVLLAVIVVGCFLAVTKDIPLVNEPYTMQAAFKDSSGIRKGSPVRIAGVDVGKVTKVAATAPGARSATLTMAITKNGLPIHADAIAKIRPRIFLEGNFFVDLAPGRPGTKVLKDGGMLPIAQTANPVQFDQVLDALKEDVRADLQTTVTEIGRAQAAGGGKAAAKTLNYQPAAYKFSAIVSEALLGRRPHDLSSFIRSQGIVSAAFDEDPAALQGLVTSFNATTQALADRQADLQAAVRELPITLRTALPTLAALNRSFPAVRAFAKAAVPGVRSTGPTVDVVLPLVKQLRGLVGQDELRGLSQDLRAATPSLASLSTTSVPLLGELRALGSCVSSTLVPFGDQTLTDPNFPARGKVFEEIPKSFVGLAGESRSSDANGQWFKVLGTGGPETVSLGNGLVGSAVNKLQGVNPPPQVTPPPLEPTQPCENQELPDLRTVPGSAPASKATSPTDPAIVARSAAAQQVAVEELQAQLKAAGDPTKVLNRSATRADIVGGLKAQRAKAGR